MGTKHLAANETHQKEILDLLELKCNVLLDLDRQRSSFDHPEFNNATSYCERLWDKILCWPPTWPNQTAWILCPEYIDKFNINGKASRFCTKSGTWWTKNINGVEKPYADYTQCKHLPPLVAESPLLNDTDRYHIFRAAYPFLSMISVTGYAISLVSLVFAFAILTSIKRLYCPRNTLHANLFLAFIIHAIAALSTGSAAEAGPGSVQTQDSYYLQNGVACRLLMVFFHYAIVAKNFWIFIEGLYLNNVVTFSFSTDRSNIQYHVVGGWITPIFFVLIWAICRWVYDDAYCWKINKESPRIFWILRGPITATIVMNFLFFINIVRLIFIKFHTQSALHEHQPSSSAKKIKYRRLAKSTLILLAVFGTHFFILLIIEEISLETSNIYSDLVLLSIDLAFNSCQGCLAAVLFCFANAEVQNEIKRIATRTDSALGTLSRTGSRISHRIRYISEAEKNAESIKMNPRHTAYSSFDKATLQVPALEHRPSSCESLYLQTADNSDEEH